MSKRGAILCFYFSIFTLEENIGQSVHASAKFKQQVFVTDHRSLVSPHTELDSSNQKSMHKYYRDMALVYDSLIRKYRSIIEFNHQRQTTEILNSALASEGIENLSETADQLSQLEEKLKGDYLEVKKITALYHQLKYKARTENKWSIFPVRTSSDVLFFYNREQGKKESKYFASTKFSFTPSLESYSLYSEAFHDYFGPVRVGIGALISPDHHRDEEDEDEHLEDAEISYNSQTLSNLSNGGGNIIFNFGYPILYYNSSATNFSFNANFNPTVSIDIPLLTDEKSANSINTNITVNSTIVFGGWLDEIDFIANLRCSRIIGNQAFYQQIDKPDHKSFFLNKLGLGLIMNKKFVFSCDFYWGQVDLSQKINSTISLSLYME